MVEWRLEGLWTRGDATDRGTSGRAVHVSGACTCHTKVPVYCGGSRKELYEDFYCQMSDGVKKLRDK